MEKSEKMLEIKDICKAFPGVKALDNVSMDFYKGEVVALLGENGAGKSTLMKILSGAYTRDRGEIILEGKNLPKNYSTLDARNYGVAIIYQELSLLNEMSVMENIYITHEPRKLSYVIDYPKMQKMAEAQLAKLNVTHIDGKKRVGDLPLSEKQMIEIAKALAIDCKVLVMDEPTTSLTWEESSKLFDIIDELRKQGITVIYISHRLDEIFKICDRAIVMRDGKVVGEKQINECTQDDIIEMMSGKVLQVDLSNRRHEVFKNTSTPLLEVENISDGRFIEDLCLCVYEGEVLGIGGLVGSKRTELFRMICSIDPRKTGSVKVSGKKVKISSAGDAIKNGIGYLSENRKDDGLSLGLSVEENTIHCDMNSVSKAGVLNWKKVRNISDGFITKLKTKGNSTMNVVNLSGGNQQKVAISKWIHAGCNLLIFDEPTKGIDVTSKAEIHQLIRSFVKEGGKAAVVISSEVNELLAVSDRLIVMSKGHIIGELTGDEIEQNNVLKCITTKGR
jgi:ribose transport system ATP-binding protein